MASSNWIVYDKFKERLFDGEIDLDTDVIKALLVDANYTPSISADEDLADVSADEIVNGGYAQQTLTVTTTKSGSTTTFDVADFSFGAMTVSSVAPDYCIIYDDTHASNALICYMRLDTGGAQTIDVGESAQITVNASGVFTISGATS